MMRVTEGLAQPAPHTETQVVEVTQHLEDLQAPVYCTAGTASIAEKPLAG